MFVLTKPRFAPALRAWSRFTQRQCSLDAQQQFFLTSTCYPLESPRKCGPLKLWSLRGFELALSRERCCAKKTFPHRTRRTVEAYLWYLGNG